jgi:hypothetical protein
MKNVVLWDVTPCGSYRNRRFGGMYRSSHPGDKNQRARANVSTELLVTANVFPSSLIIFTLMMEAIRYSETSVLTSATRCHISEDGILYHLCSSYSKIRSNHSRKMAWTMDKTQSIR